MCFKCLLVCVLSACEESDEKKSLLFFSLLCVLKCWIFRSKNKKFQKVQNRSWKRDRERKRETKTFQKLPFSSFSVFFSSTLYRHIIIYTYSSTCKTTTKKKMRTSSHHHDENNNNNNNDERIKLVVWDFDMTILRIHSFAKRISALDVPRRDYERDCADANFFRAFLREMKQKSIKVAIASFGKREVIETYLKCLVDRKKGDEDLAEYAFNEKKKSIVTPNDVGGTDGCSMKDKSRMLDALTKRYVLSMNEEDISSAQGEDPVESSSSA